jgi:predicted MFS family arabinose efflux permease
MQLTRSCSTVSLKKVIGCQLPLGFLLANRFGWRLHFMAACGRGGGEGLGTLIVQRAIFIRHQRCASKKEEIKQQSSAGT